MRSVQSILDAKLAEVRAIKNEKMAPLRESIFRDTLTTATSVETSKAVTGLSAETLFNPDGVYDSTALIESFLRSASSKSSSSSGYLSFDDVGSTAYDDIISRVAASTGLDASLIKGLIKAESNFNTNAVSSAGAQGLTQLMPGTAKALGVTDPFDPVQNITAGAEYLKKQIERCGGDIRMALASYNAGFYRLKELGIESSNSAEYSLLSQGTRSYVEKVLQYSGAIM